MIGVGLLPRHHGCRLPGVAQRRRLLLAWVYSANLRRSREVRSSTSAASLIVRVTCRQPSSAVWSLAALLFLLVHLASSPFSLSLADYLAHGRSLGTPVGRPCSVHTALQAPVCCAVCVSHAQHPQAHGGGFFARKTNTSYRPHLYRVAPHLRSPSRTSPPLPAGSAAPLRCSLLVPHTHTLSPEGKEPQGNASDTPRHACDPATLMGSYHGAPMGSAFPEG